MPLLTLARYGSGLLFVRRAWPQAEGRLQVDGLQAEVTVTRDSWGIPHIYAANPHDPFFA